MDAPQVAELPLFSVLKRWTAQHEAHFVGVFVLMMMLWPKAWSRDVVLGHSRSETANHLWMFWRALDGRSPLTNLPDGLPIPLMDPINLPIFAIGAVVSPGVGWLLLRAFSIGLALVGGYLLCRRWTEPRAAMVGMVAIGASPIQGSLQENGLTELWTIGWFCLHLAFLVDVARGAGWRRGLVAGALLGCTALSGWYMATFALMFEIPVVVWLWVRHRRWMLVAQGGIGAVMVLPSLWNYLQVRTFWTGRLAQHTAEVPPPIEDWESVNRLGTDLVNLFTPQIEPVEPARLFYLGWVTLALAVIGLARRTRTSLPWLAAAVAFVAVALGPWPSVGGTRVGVVGPAWWLVELFPILQGISHWERAALFVVPPLAVLVAFGIQAAPRMQKVAWVWVVLLLVDGLCASGAHWPRVGFPLVLPPGFGATQGNAGLIQVPFDNHVARTPGDVARPYDLWQILHERPVSENYEGVDSLLVNSRLIAAIHYACGTLETLPEDLLPNIDVLRAGAPRGTDLRLELRQLRMWGYDEIILHRERCPQHASALKVLKDTLGRPTGRAGADLAWVLPTGEAEVVPRDARRGRIPSASSRSK